MRPPIPCVLPSEDAAAAVAERTLTLYSHKRLGFNTCPPSHSPLDILAASATCSRALEFAAALKAKTSRGTQR
jgi:hypothetical protein